MGNKRLKTNVALVFTCLNELGGQNNHLKNIYFGLEKQFEVYLVLTSRVKKVSYQFFLKGGIPPERLVFISRYKKWSIVFFIFDLVRFLKEKKIEIVHTFQEQSDILGGLAARLAGVKNLFSYCESKIIPDNIFPPKAFFYKRMNIIMKKWFRKTVVVSKGLKEEIIRTKYRMPDTLEVIHLGVQIPDRYAGKVYSAENLRKKSPVVGTIARFSYEKALERIIRASVFFVQHYPQSKFVLVGGGYQESFLRKLAKELKVDNYFIIKQWTNDVYRELAQMDIFVMSSIREGCPNALLEALALALPVVASKIEGIKDIIEDEKEGLLVDTANSVLFAEKMLSLCQNPDKAIVLGENGRRKVLNSFALDYEMQQLRKLYAGISEEGNVKV